MLYQRHCRFISFIDTIENTKVCILLRVFERNAYDETMRKHFSQKSCVTDPLMQGAIYDRCGCRQEMNMFVAEI